MTTLRFDVSDTGIGITPEDLMRVFEPFQQMGDDAYKAQGTGLGLAISRDLIRLMGGDLQVTSVVGRGSRFWFELTVPVIAAVDARRSKSRQIVGIQGAAPKILVVEDDSINRQMLVDLLTDVGCDLREADNGQSGWRVCRTFRPQAILLDLRMPAMDGLTLMRHIRRAPEFDQVAIITMSACVYDEDRQQSLDAGSQAFLPKPIDLDVLLELLQQFLHLTWRFQEAPGHVESVSGCSSDESPPSALTPEALATLPAGMLRRLKKAALIADRDALNHVFDEVRQIHPHIADSLDALTQNLDNSMIIDFIAQLTYKKAVE